MSLECPMGTFKYRVWRKEIPQKIVDNDQLPKITYFLLPCFPVNWDEPHWVCTKCRSDFQESGCRHPRGCRRGQATADPV